MLRMRWIGCFLVVALLLGCEKPKGQARYAVTTTTTRPANVGEQTSTPAAQPPSRPASSSLLIGNQIVTFPRARLLLQETQPEVALLLFSDDPRDALDPTYSGNRYYLQIKLDIGDIANLTAADWHFKASSIERADTPDGIFLEGDRQHLQPYDVTIIFNQLGPQVAMALSGQFLLFQTRPGEAGPPRTALVQGTLMAELEMPRRLRKTEGRGAGAAGR